MSKYEDFIDSSFELYDAKLRLEQAKTDLAFTRILALVGWIGFMVATALVSYSAEAQEAPRCGNNGCYCYIDPYSKSTVCRKYP